MSSVKILTIFGIIILVAAFIIFAVLYWYSKKPVFAFDSYYLWVWVIPGLIGIGLLVAALIIHIRHK